MTPNGWMVRATTGGLLGLSLIASGCHSGSDGKGGLITAGSATAGVTSGATAASLPPGVTVRGLPPNPVALLEGPALDIVSPVRGAYLAATRRVPVEGVVTDLGQGVAEVHVQGRTVPVAPNGAFRAEVDLEVGLNTITVEAWDSKQQRRERHVSVIAGDLSPETDLLPDVASIRVTESALDLVEPSIKQGVEAQRAQIVAQVLASKPGNDTKVTGFSFGAVGAAVDAVQGGARFTITIDDLAMDIEHKAKVLLIFSTTKKGTVRASRLTIEGTTAITVQGGRAVTRVTAVTAAAAGFSVPDWASSESGNIKRSFEQSFAAAASTALDQGLSQAFKTTSGTVQQTVQGAATTIDWALSGLSFDDAGATAVFGANLKGQGPTVGKETRSVVTRSPLANLAGGAVSGPNVAIAINQDLLNRGLHSAWRGGALRHTIDQAALQKLSGGTPVVLDTTALVAAVPELAQILPPGLPVEMGIDGELPPVLTLRAGDIHLLDIGSLKVSTRVIDPVKGKQPLLDCVYAVRAEVKLVDAPGGLRLELAGKVEVHVDAVGNAQPGSELVAERMAQQSGAQLIGTLLAAQQTIALPAVQGVALSGVKPSSVDRNLILLGTAAAAVRP